MLENLIENNYLRFLVLVIAGFFILRSFLFILGKFVLKLASKTSTDLDDVVLKKSSKPLTFLVLMIIFRLALVELNLQNNIVVILEKVIFSLILVDLFIVLYIIFFLFLERGWKKISKKSFSKKNQGLFNLFEGFLKITVILAGFLVVLNYWGIEIGPLLAGIGIGGVAIAFALQSSLGNIFGGISIILDDSIRIGDLVNLPDGTFGKILKIGLRSTKIRTFDNEIIIVPNGKLADGNIHNVAQPDPKSRVAISFGVAYGSDVKKVKKIVLKEIEKVDGFVKDPEPSVRFLEMGDSSLNFKAFFFVDSFEKRFSAIDEANTRIYDALRKAKIEIPFPQMDVHLKK